MKETVIFMVLVCIGSGGAFLVWKKTGNHDVDYLIRMIGWIIIGFSIYGIIDLTKWATG